MVCLTMSYFHGRLPTIIGARAFHGPVRDGKEWFHRAMVIRHDLLLPRPAAGKPIRKRYRFVLVAAGNSSRRGM